MATHKGVKILCISVIRISERVWLMHRIYDEQDIRKIGISMPDIINHGSLLLFLEDFDC